MATVVEKSTRVFGPESNGILMTPREFDRAEFEEDWRSELIHGVLIVPPIPSRAERDPNEELGHWLRRYQKEHPEGTALDATLAEELIRTPRTRRRAVRVIWTGLGRRPKSKDIPSVVVEFVSSGRRDRYRDYEEKRDEYMELGIQEYWIIHRFSRTMTVYFRQGGKTRKRVIREDQVYRTNLLPGFELSFGKLLALADQWKEEKTVD